MFTPIREKLNTLIPDAKEIDAFNHFSTIVERMIVNGHAAHKTIPGYDKCKPEIETYKVFDGITIPVHGYADFKGKIIIEDKCKFPKRGRVKKDGTRSWLTNKLPESVEPYNFLQIDFYYSVFKLPIYICYINEESYKVFSADNCDDLKPENIEKRIPKIIQRCKIRQNLMKISTDPNVVKDYIQPQFDHYFWRNEMEEDYLTDAIKFYES